MFSLTAARYRLGNFSPFWTINHLAFWRSVFPLSPQLLYPLCPTSRVNELRSVPQHFSPPSSSVKFLWMKVSFSTREPAFEQFHLVQEAPGDSAEWHFSVTSLIATQAILRVCFKPSQNCWNKNCYFSNRNIITFKRNSTEKLIFPVIRPFMQLY